jgi:outer membrane receptor protein involved in Fe transport
VAPTPSAPPVEVVVKGTSPSEELRRSPFPVTVIDVRRYAGRAADLNELIHRTAGVKILRSGGAGSAARISVRGLEGNRVAIFIDGQPITQTDSGFGLNDIPIQAIERIEIYKGVVPARLGGDGLGSAVNIVLRDLRHSYVDAAYLLASHNTHRGFALGKYVDADRGFKLGVGALASYAENDYLMPRRGGPPVRRDHDAYDSMLFGVSFEHNRTWFDKVKVEAVVARTQKELQGVPATSASSVGQYNIQHARTRGYLWVVGTELEKANALPGVDLSYDLLTIGRAGNLRDLSPYVYDFDGRRTPSPSGTGEVGRGPNDSADQRLEVRQNVNANYEFVPAHALNLNQVLGATVDRPDDPVADAAYGFDTTPGAGRLLRSISGLSYESRWLDERLVAVAGVKHFAYRASGALTSAYEILSGSPERYTDARQAAGANVAARYQLAAPLLVKASYEHSVRLPTALELFGDGFLIQGAPRLRPEKGDNFTGGFYLDWGEFPRRLRLDGVAFVSFVQDLITLGGTMARSHANVGRVQIRGLELDLKVDVASFLYVYVNGTLQDVRNTAEYLPGTTQPNFLRGLTVPNVPRAFANGGVEVPLRRLFGAGTQLRLYYDASYVAEYFYEYEVSENQSRRVPSYLVHSLGAQYSMSDSRYSLSVEVDNVGDAQRYDQFGLPLPGRVLRALLRVTTL